MHLVVLIQNVHRERGALSVHILNQKEGHTWCAATHKSCMGNTLQYGYICLAAVAVGLNPFSAINVGKLYYIPLKCVCEREWEWYPYLSVWFMGVHECYGLSLSDQYCLRVSQPGHSQLLTLDQHRHTCGATPQTLSTHTHTQTHVILKCYCNAFPAT